MYIQEFNFLLSELVAKYSQLNFKDDKKSKKDK